MERRCCSTGNWKAFETIEEAVVVDFVVLFKREGGGALTESLVELPQATGFLAAIKEVKPEQEDDPFTNC